LREAALSHARTDAQARAADAAVAAARAREAGAAAILVGAQAATAEVRVGHGWGSQNEAWRRYAPGSDNGVATALQQQGAAASTVVGYDLYSTPEPSSTKISRRPPLPASLSLSQQQLDATLKLDDIMDMDSTGTA